MSTNLLIGVAAIAVSAAAQAHPGHPTLGVEHSHSFFGIDPAYGLPITLALVATGLLWRTARARGDRRR